MKILITGGAGFIGSHIADACIRAGYTTHIIDNLSTGARANIPPEAVFHEMDIRSDKPKQLWEQEQFSVLIHTAAQMNVRKSVEDPVMDADINVLGSLNLLEAGRRNGLQKVVFSSTGGAVYGEPVYAPQDEQHPINPVSPYGITKRSLEHYLSYYTKEYGIQTVSLRYANVYGPRQNSKGEAGVVAIFTEQMLAGRTCYINGDGQQTRDYIYVADVVEANMKALSTNHSATYNVGTGRETSVVALFDQLKNVIDPEVEPRHREAMPGEQQRSVIDSGKLSEELSWQQHYTLEEGLRETVAWFKQANVQA